MRRLTLIGFLLLSWLPLLVGQAPLMRILPLGDSITDGTALGTPGFGGYRGPLGSLLTGAGYNVDFVGTQTNNGANIPDPDHEGHSGWRIDMIDAQIANWLASVAGPDVVLMHIGTNDFPHGSITLQDPAYTANAINRLDAIILKIATLRPNAHIIVTNLMERDDNQPGQPDFDALIQSQFNPFVRARVTAHAAAGRRVTFLDMRVACPLSDMPDRLHPNQAGYNKMADAWFSAIWKVISPLGQVKGAQRDLNGDGLADLVFQNASGQIAAWFLDGTGNALNFSTGSGVKPGSKTLYPFGLGDWRVAGTTDINRDGLADMLFQNSSGQIAAWFLDATGNALNFSTGSGLEPGSKMLYSFGLGDWMLVGTTDINLDGYADIVFQNSIGQIAAWFLDGTGNALNFSTGSGLKPGSKMLYPLGLGDWRVVGTTDINRDGCADIVFQNSIGQIYAWFLDGTGNVVNFSTGSGLKPGSKMLYPFGLGDWRVVGTADINRDGCADIVFQNSIGQIYAWFLDGTGNVLNFSTGSGLKPGSKLLSPAGLGDWKIR